MKYFQDVYSQIVHWSSDFGVTGRLVLAGWNFEGLGTGVLTGFADE